MLREEEEQQQQPTLSSSTTTSSTTSSNIINLNSTTTTIKLNQPNNNNNNNNNNIINHHHHHHHLINLTASSIKPHKSRHNRQPSKRQVELEDELLYGPPSPRPSRPPSRQSHLDKSTHSFSPTTPAEQIINHEHHHWTNSDPVIAHPSTDELFLSESYPPIHSRLTLPFFNEKLPSPIGMGRGQPIVSPSYPSPAYGSLDRLWKRITRTLVEKPYQLPELADTLSYPANELSIDSINRLLEPYHLALPQVIRDHFLTHDGQDVFTLNSARCSGSAPLGIVWGLWLMSCEEVEAEWGFWRRFDGGLMPGDAFAATDFSSSSHHHQQDPHHSSPPATNTNPPRVDQGMSSCPAGWVREVYSHPAWIPLLSDRVGNYIGIDLSPPPNSSYPTPRIPTTTKSSSSSSSSSSVDGRRLGGGQGNARPEAGQVIAFGREIDEKVVLWRGEGRDGWANWLASFADDLEDGNFARLIGKKRALNKSHHRSTSRRDSDGGERGWTHSDEDSEDTEDGLGELGYFNDGAGFGGAASDDGDFYGWRLAPEYRGMSVIEALCARSKQRWAEVGSYSSRYESFDSRSQSRSSSSRRSTQLANIQAGPSRVSDPNRRDDSTPPTPIAYVTPPSPRPPEAELAPEPSSSSSSVTPVSSGKKPEPGLQPVLVKPTPSQPRRRTRPPPPAPVSLDLPTMDSLLLEVDEGPSRASSAASSASTSSSAAHTPLDTSTSSTPKLVSRLSSIVTQRISGEFSRRASPVLPSNQHHLKSSSPRELDIISNKSLHLHDDENDAIGMVILDHHHHQDHPTHSNPSSNLDHPLQKLSSSSSSTPNTLNNTNHTHSHSKNKNASRLINPTPSQGLGIIRTES
ncbi:Cell wall assembly regulator [Puccinia graminis f. sp. tritici]|uniref:Cell wall assembly regulator n=2 Tax=Puccinia graminis f. sp. tritici TaxID=56615 RepID=A0A5B0QYY9_PUCGR|nr:Cell wall assembly regulator [Puccinia graminis f. sp. tritici]